MKNERWWFVVVQRVLARTRIAYTRWQCWNQYQFSESDAINVSKCHNDIQTIDHTGSITRAVQFDEYQCERFAEWRSTKESFWYDILVFNLIWVYSKFDKKKSPFFTFSPPFFSDDINDTPRANHSIFSIEFYQKFFNVDANVVLERIMAAIIPRRAPIHYMKQEIDTNPDLYGPFWIVVTLVCGVWSDLAILSLQKLFNFL